MPTLAFFFNILLSISESLIFWKKTISLASLPLPLLLRLRLPDGFPPSCTSSIETVPNVSSFCLIASSVSLVDTVNLVWNCLLSFRSSSSSSSSSFESSFSSFSAFSSRSMSTTASGTSGLSLSDPASVISIFISPSTSFSASDFSLAVFLSAFSFSSPSSRTGSFFLNFDFNLEKNLDFFASGVAGPDASSSDAGIGSASSLSGTLSSSSASASTAPSAAFAAASAASAAASALSNSLCNFSWLSWSFCSSNCFFKMFTFAASASATSFAFNSFFKFFLALAVCSVFANFL